MPEQGELNFVAVVTEASALTKNGESTLTLAERQEVDPELKLLQDYMQDWTLPQEGA